MCFVTSKELPASKGKGFDLDFPCYSSSFIFNSKCNFSFQFQCVIPFLFVFLLSSFHFQPYRPLAGYGLPPPGGIL